MARAEAKFDIKAEDKFSKNFTKAKKGLGGLNTGALTLAKSFAGLAGVAGFGALARGAMSLGSELTHVSDRLDISVEAVSALRATAMDTGSNMQSLERALRNFKERTAKAADGSKSLQEALHSVNLEAADLNGMPMEQGLARFAKAITEMEGTSEAFLATQQILGVKAGPELLSLLKELGGGWDEYSEKMKKAGRVMDDETARALEAAETNIDILKDRMTIAVGKPLGDILGDDPRRGVTQLLGKAVTGAGNFLDFIDEGIGAAVPDQLRFLPGLSGEKSNFGGTSKDFFNWLDVPTGFQDQGNPFIKDQKAKRQRLSEGMESYSASAAQKTARIEEENGKMLTDINKVLDKIEGNTAGGGVFGGS